MTDILGWLVAGSVAYVLLKKRAPREDRAGGSVPPASAFDEFLSGLTAIGAFIGRQLVARKYRREHCAWFWEFRVYVCAAMQGAERVIAIQDGLKDPLFREAYDSQLLLHPDHSIRPAGGADPSWISDKAPAPPRSTRDPVRDWIRKDVYDAEMERHQAFLAEICEKLRREPRLKEPFRWEMMALGIDSSFIDRPGETDIVASAQANRDAGDARES